MKAMILAAGRGERLRPLTDTLPKPLIPVAGKPLIVHHLLRLAAIGIQDVVINISYRAADIRQTLGDGSNYGVNIFYSLEINALNTGGGIVQALPLLGDEPFILLSADIYTDYSLQQLVKPITGLAHLVMVDNPSYHPYGDFAWQADKLVISESERLTYANIGVYHPALFKNAPPGKFPLVQLLKPAIVEGLVTGEYYQGFWHNIGTVEDLEAVEN